MTLLEKLKGMGTYSIKVKCRNCSKISIIKIPKGITISEFLDEKGGGCANCGCETITYTSTNDYVKREEWSKNV